MTHNKELLRGLICLSIEAWQLYERLYKVDPTAAEIALSSYNTIDMTMRSYGAYFYHLEKWGLGLTAEELIEDLG